MKQLLELGGRVAKKKKREREHIDTNVGVFLRIKKSIFVFFLYCDFYI